MNQAQLIVAALEAAKDTVRHYWTDIRHDARLFAEAEPGTAFLWAPYESGTRIVVLMRDFRPNKRAAETFRAMDSLGSLAWHIVRIKSDGCDFEPITCDAAKVAANAMETLAAMRGVEAVSELHL
jgi:hypothetical protein